MSRTTVHTSMRISHPEVWNEDISQRGQEAPMTPRYQKNGAYKHIPRNCGCSTCKEQAEIMEHAKRKYRKQDAQILRTTADWDAVQFPKRRKGGAW